MNPLQPRKPLEPQKPNPTIDSSLLPDSMKPASARKTPVDCTNWDYDVLERRLQSNEPPERLQAALILGLRCAHETDTKRKIRIMELLNDRVNIEHEGGDQNVEIGTMIALGTASSNFSAEEVLSLPRIQGDAFGHVRISDELAYQTMFTLNRAGLFSTNVVKALASQWATGRFDVLVGISSLLTEAGEKELEKVVKLAEEYHNKPLDDAPEVYKEFVDAINRLTIQITGEEYRPIDAQMTRDSDIIGQALRENCQECLQPLPGEKRVVFPRLLARHHAVRFRRVQTDFPPSVKNILTLYGGNIDRTYVFTAERDSTGKNGAQEFVDTAIADIAEMQGNTVAAVRGEILAKIQGNKLSELKTEEDAVTAIVRRIAGIDRDKGLPVSKGNYQLEKWIDNVFEKASQNLHQSELSERSKLSRRDIPGGGSSNIAFNLGREPNVTVYLAANNQQLAAGYPEDRIRRLMISEAGTETRMLFHDTGSLQDPVEVNRVVEFETGVRIEIGSEKYVSESTDRYIIKNSGAYDSNGNPAKNFFKKPYIDFAGYSEQARLRTLDKIGETQDYVILNGLQYATTETNFSEMNGQVGRIRESAQSSGRNLVLHAEISGEPGQYIKRIIRRTKDAGVDSLGMSDDDILPLLTYMTRDEEFRIPLAFHEDTKELKDTNGEVINKDTLTDQVKVYRYCSMIAKSLGLKRLYVHGGSLSNTDLVLRADIHSEDNGTLERMRLEQLGQLYTKFAAATKVLARIAEPGKPIHENLKAESIAELARIAKGLADSMDKQGGERRDFMSSFLKEGMIVAPAESGDFSAVFVPLKWYANRPLFITGAGDTSTGNSIAYSGMALSLDEVRAVLREFDRKKGMDEFFKIYST